jgi:pimeloyl-ACP methyl ester carboxylesterase
LYELIASQGFLVFCFDQLGMGSRVYETVNGVGQHQDRGTSSAWYDRQSHTEWSQLGKMVQDVSAAVDFLLAPSTGRGHPFHSGNWSFPRVVPAQVFVVGYGLGAAVGLHAAALDVRIAGVASVCGFGSLRASVEGSRGGGLRRIFELHQLQPRLGFFVDKPEELPYDYDDVLSLILTKESAAGNQRKVFVLSSKDDRVHNVSEVESLVRSLATLPPLARQGLTLSTPVGVNRLDDGKQHAVVDWLRAVVADVNNTHT